MPNYILLLHEDPSEFEQISPEEIQAIIARYTEWKDRMVEEGFMISGEKLQDGTGRVLRKVEGRTTITDGPYTESKEVIGGLFMIRAENYEQAVEIAHGCPHVDFGAVEVREVDNV